MYPATSYLKSALWTVLLQGGAMAIDDDLLRSTVAFGPERTLE